MEDVFNGLNVCVIKHVNINMLREASFRFENEIPTNDNTNSINFTNNNSINSINIENIIDNINNTLIDNNENRNKNTGILNTNSFHFKSSEESKEINLLEHPLNNNNTNIINNLINDNRNHFIGNKRSIPFNEEEEDYEQYFCEETLKFNDTSFDNLTLPNFNHNNENQINNNNNRTGILNDLLYPHSETSYLNLNFNNEHFEDYNNRININNNRIHSIVTSNYININSIDNNINNNNNPHNRNRRGRRRRRNGRMTNEEINSIINGLNKTTISDVSILDENKTTCPICLEDFKKDDEIYTLDCKHILHVECLNEEIKHRRRCPICRTNIR